MTQNNTNKVVVVTGAAQGLGEALAIWLAERGWGVALVDCQACNHVVANIEASGNSARGYTCDVTDEKAVAELPKMIEHDFGYAALALVNNAAILKIYGSLAEITADMWRQTMTVNVEGPFLMARDFAPAMIESKWGRIVNVSSTSIYSSSDMFLPYMTSKQALLGFTTGLANELGQHGITVNAVSPGLTSTPALQMAEETGLLPPNFMDYVVQTQSIKRVSEPNDMASAIAYLLSDDAGFITGQFLAADGGFSRR